jgi:hypothetical protein
MAVAYDSSAESHTGAVGSISEASFTWQHNPTGTPAGITVFVVNVVAAAYIATSVTYDGVDVPEVTACRVQQASGETGAVQVFHLGSGVPTTDPADVVVNRTNNTNELWAVSVSVTAALDTEIYTTGIVTLTGDGTLAVQSVDDGSPGSNSLRLAGGHSGLNSPPGGGTGTTNTQSFDTGSQTAAVARETTPGQGSRNVGFSSGTTAARAIAHFAVRETIGGPNTVVSPAAIATALSTAAVPVVAVLPGLASVAASAVSSAVDILVGPLAAIANAVAPAPVVDVGAGGGDATVIGVPAIALAVSSAPVPAVTVSSVAVAATPAPSPTPVITVPAARASATAVSTAPVPEVRVSAVAVATASGGTFVGVDLGVSPPSAIVNAVAPAPAVSSSSGTTVQAPSAIVLAVSTAPVPAITITSVATALAVAPAPIVSSGADATVVAAPAVASALSTAPVVRVTVLPAAALSTAVASAPVPAITITAGSVALAIAPIPGITSGSSRTVIAPAALAVVTAPSPFIQRPVRTGAATALAQALAPIPSLTVTTAAAGLITLAPSPLLTKGATKLPPPAIARALITAPLLAGQLTFLEPIYTGRIGRGWVGSINGREQGHISDTVGGLIEEGVTE